MSIPEKIGRTARPWFGGALIGFILTLYLSLHFGVLMTADDVKKAAAEAVIAVLIPVCAQDFIQNASPEQYKGFKTADAYDRRKMIERVVTSVPADRMTFTFTTLCSNAIDEAQDNSKKEILVQ